MLTKGYLLIFSDGSPYEPYESTIAFSENKEELEKEASERNLILEETLNKFKNNSDDIQKYEEKFYEFYYSHPEHNKVNFQKWIIGNPIPTELEKFIEIFEYEENNNYEISLNTTSDHDLSGHYYVQSFGKIE